MINYVRGMQDHPLSPTYSACFTKCASSAWNQQYHFISPDLWSGCSAFSFIHSLLPRQHSYLLFICRYRDLWISQNYMQKFVFIGIFILLGLKSLIKFIKYLWFQNNLILLIKKERKKEKKKEKEKNTQTQFKPLLRKISISFNKIATSGKSTFGDWLIMGSFLYTLHFSP